jgi:hypothetical protein
MLTWPGEAVATRVPVGPAAAWGACAASEVTLYVPAVEARSQRSLMPAGAVIEELMATP